MISSPMSVLLSFVTVVISYICHHTRCFILNPPELLVLPEEPEEAVIVDGIFFNTFGLPGTIGK
jgi:hypothetical protein